MKKPIKFQGLLSKVKVKVTEKCIVTALRLILFSPLCLFFFLINLICFVLQLECFSCCRSINLTHGPDTRADFMHQQNQHSGCKTKQLRLTKPQTKHNGKNASSFDIRIWEQ